ncbi:MAG: hypothetical protein HYY24_07590 [Verrucomicrobia bacterium]|nr:hypothetical protein [Verrucomicrobiota bacterium]
MIRFFCLIRRVAGDQEEPCSSNEHERFRQWSTGQSQREAIGGQVTLRNLEESHGIEPEEVERLAADVPLQLRVETKQNLKGGPQSRVLTLVRR